MAGGAIVDGPGLGANAPKNKWAGVLIVTFAAFGGILYGYDTGVINGIQTMQDWLCTFGSPDPTAAVGCSITSGQQSLVVSILSVGTFVGALLGAPIADHAGRKYGVVIAAVVFMVGVAMQVASTALGLFIGGRVIAGLGVGIVSTLVPMYQSECAPKWIRGAVVSGYQWAITIGLLLASVINNSTHLRLDHSSYRIPISIQFVWATILIVGMLFLPESPRWLIKQGRDEAAAKSLSRLVSLPADHPEIEAELDEIRANLAAEQALGESSYLDCFKTSHNKILLRTLTGIFIQAWQQLTGINFIFYYGTKFFESSGINDSFIVSVAANIVNMFMTIPGIWGIERYGRRRLLLIGAAGMCVCEFIIAIVGVTVSTDNHSGQKVLIAFVMIYIAFFASTWGPIAWVVVGEIFPLAVRAKAISLSTSSNWLWNFAIGYATPYLVNPGKGNANLGVKVFFIWGSTCAGCLVFTYFCVPETKGLSLEQIDVLYQNTTPRQSVAYRAQLERDGQVLGSTSANGGLEEKHIAHDDASEKA